MLFVLSRAGGIGLGLVMGWLLGSAPLPSSPVRGLAVLAALGSAVAVSVAIAGPEAGVAFVFGVLVGFVCRRGLEHLPRLGG